MELSDLKSAVALLKKLCHQKIVRNFERDTMRLCGSTNCKRGVDAFPRSAAGYARQLKIYNYYAGRGQRKIELKTFKVFRF